MFNLKAKKRQQGFTLIEMIIVATIIGILGGVVISVIDPARVTDRSADSVRLGTVGKIVEAAEAYANLEGEYPSQNDLLNSVYINSWPIDVPKSGDTYQYGLYGSNFYVYVQTSQDGWYYKYFSHIGQTRRCHTSNPATVGLDDCMTIN